VSQPSSLTFGELGRVKAFCNNHAFKRRLVSVRVLIIFRISWIESDTSRGTQALRPANH